MDLQELFIEDGIRDEILEFAGKEWPLKIKPLSWTKKNQILSKCFNYETNGAVQFDFDKYMKTMLCEMIVSAPWGETNFIFLNKIKADFGKELEKLVPKAFDEVKDKSFFVKESTS